MKLPNKRSLNAAVGAVLLVCAGNAAAEPKVIVISLDGATPEVIEELVRQGALPRDKGLGLLARRGAVAERNITVNPSLTAAAHIAIATGSTAARNNIPGNTFHLLASPFNSNASGFGAPIGGYCLHPLGESGAAHPATAEPLWIAMRAAGRKVVTATFPGGDGVDVRVPGLAGSPIIQSAGKRTVDFTVPFGAFGGAGAQGFALNAASFTPAGVTLTNQLSAAGKVFYGTVMQTTTTLLQQSIGGVPFTVRAAALDTTNDGVVNYDTLVVYDETNGVKPGPFAPPSTGPATLKLSDARSAQFYFEGSSTKAGTAFYVSAFAPDLSTVRITRYATNFIPRNAAVLADVDDINNSVGFWAPQPDFRIPEKLSPGFDTFPDAELEAIYQDQVRTFVDYQVRVALRAIERNRDADVVMTYIEQPDGSGHQFTLTDPRQPTDIKNPASIGSGQDKAKIARYRNYVRSAYQVADAAVQRIIDAVGTDSRGRPRSNIIVVSDHGMAPFHTAVNLNAYLAGKGFDPSKVRAVTSGPAANIYINLLGRDPAGTVTRQEYVELQEKLKDAVREFEDTNPNYVRGRGDKVFDFVKLRPVPADLNSPEFGLATSRLIGQDSGDVYAVLNLGYNFDGTQSPVVPRLGDPVSTTPPVLSLPNFYGAHGYDPDKRQMSAIFYAAGPDVCRRKFKTVRNIDVAPTILKLFDVAPAVTVQGKALDLWCDRDHHKADHEDRDDRDDD